ncbi:hypothetical protein Q2T83_03020 [Fervidibacter sacchari]|jgi:hypothetical protein|uniref:Uncharacterized protein n=1 Tax=Candidatus Fervidibacter sacchari TaxID=1448929 RepID=A0ABT2EST3_9BACT|nr:hypothetical protein [Candidatus Fervidibacter sacchari]MCS3919960.1 hypothetical protein [Candidatus Fervidibacter sacchari]WKU16805.1 hypothetical protein Q2T83_03020 [Candidatus Fervidibacter sacchari]
MEQKEIRWVGYIRKPVWDDIQQRPQTRLYTGTAVYNLPHLFVEPQDEDEWLEVEVTIKVVREMGKDK